MMNDKYGIIDFESLLSGEYMSEIVKQVKKNFFITYNKKNSVTIENKNNIERLVETDNFTELTIDSSSRYVYVIFKEEEPNPVYVGKAADVKKRLREHMKKKGSSTASKINKVYESLSEEKQTKFNIAILEIKPGKFYSAVEGLLITHYGTVENGGWNERDD